MEKSQVEQLNKKVEGLNPVEVIKCFVSEFSPIALSSSLGLEDQVLTHILAKNNIKADVFTLDTGRLFYETYDLIDKAEKRYKIKIKTYFPSPLEVEKMVYEKGINLFYESIENRKLCCNVRKIQPLRRALSNYKVWICGLRKEQSVTRENIRTVEWDELNGLLKINPIINWTEQDVWNFVNENNVPYNVLHKKNYPSIGCQPCTRAIVDGEDVRAGRWSWENPDTKECGLHKK